MNNQKLIFTGYFVERFFTSISKFWEGVEKKKEEKKEEKQ